MPSAIETFSIHASEAELAELAERLHRTRWPDAELVADGSQGVQQAWMRAICEYWRDGYDWRAREARLNQWPQYRTEVDGLRIHFLHVPSPEPNATPLLMTHGWPGSIVEFHKVLGPLTDPRAHGGDPDDAFEVICPSLPGYGFSDKPRETGWGVERIAGAWAALMARLGHRRYLAQGGDWGSMVTTALSKRDPEHCAGIHLNMAIAPPVREDLAELSAAEKAALATMDHYRKYESAYGKQQATRPQTLAYGLTDSPVGQAAWILEKFWTWVDHGGHGPEAVLSRDELLDNVMLYWLPAAAASSARLYWESFMDFDREPVTAPTALSIFPGELFRPSRRWAQRRYCDLRYFNETERGGHFAAFEQPDIFVREVRDGLRAMRSPQ
ncbi:MAG: alpha/beta fold hydrolase [Algiphilus sp.]|uniref:epoxide hydrolase family protein n=1 Tax=Algiphilus sp. TaxID=1872431 RepID=UPI002A659BBF|nr:epoxide hydrolase 1 [Pseudomonadota bacterium]